MAEPTHFAYLDESYYTTEHEFGAISMLSFPVHIKLDLENKILPILTQITGEYKWANFKSNQYIECSKNIFDILFDFATRNLLRIDTIIWQTADPNYPRNQTNSGEKLSVLFYIRLRNTLSDMWGANTVWSIMVDEQREVNWDDVKDYLAYASAKAPAASLFGYKYGIDRLGIDPCKFSIKELTSIESHTEPFIQIADIFAGAAAYSHNESKKLIHWLDYYDPQHFKGGTWQPPLDFMGEDPVQFSRRERVRFNFIKYIQDCCKANKYQVSIHSKKGLHTFSRSSNINFFYSGCDKN